MACASAARASADVTITETVLQSFAGRSSRFTQVSLSRHVVLTGGYEFIGATGGLDLSNWSLNVIFRVL